MSDSSVRRVTQADRSQQLAALFDTLADGYDRAALRFFSLAADRLAALLAPTADARVLDVATGTGAVAVAVAQRLHDGGRVMATDIAARMLDQARANVRRVGLHNVDLQPMDATQLEFQDDYFDALTCAFGLFFLEDMPSALREWRRVLRPQGRVVISSFGSTAFNPLVASFCADLAEQGGPVVEPSSFAWQRLSQPAALTTLLQANGYADVEVDQEDLGYHLQSAQEWWEIIWNSGFRAYLNGFDATSLDAFKDIHLRHCEALFTSGPVKLQVPVLFASATRAD